MNKENPTHTLMSIDVMGGRHRLPPFFVRFFVYFLFPLMLFLIQKTVVAEPYIPKNGDQVLDTLPTVVSVTINKVKELEDKVNYLPESEEIQERLINAYLQQAKTSGDMRYVSYAQNRLNIWLQSAPLSEKARFLDAKIQQYNHEFINSIVLLKSLLIDYPENTKAWSLLANLQLLTGRYHDAQTSCKQLSVRGNLADLIICQSNIMMRTGQLDKVYRMLDTLLPAINKSPVQNQLWFYTSLAELKMQQGDGLQAIMFLEKALNLAELNNIEDSYLSRIAVDYFLHHNDLVKALDIIGSNNKNDSALMVRKAVIERTLGNNPEFNLYKNDLQNIFDVEKRRGNSRHLREQALFTLIVLNDSVEALKLARKNWVSQKEPEDARILMKSALLAGDEEQLQKVISDIKKTGLVDYRLNVNRLHESII